MLVISDTSPIRALAPVLQQLTSELNFFLSDELVKRILQNVGEGGRRRSRRLTFQEAWKARFNALRTSRRGH